MRKYKIQYLLVMFCAVSVAWSLNVDNEFLESFLMSFGVVGFITNIMGIIYLEWYFKTKGE